MGEYTEQKEIERGFQVDSVLSNELKKYYEDNKSEIEKKQNNKYKTIYGYIRKLNNAYNPLDKWPFSKYGLFPQTQRRMEVKEIISDIIKTGMEEEVKFAINDNIYSRVKRFGDEVILSIIGMIIVVIILLVFIMTGTLKIKSTFYSLLSNII